jgi:hypothetical protein
MMTRKGTAMTTTAGAWAGVSLAALSACGGPAPTPSRAPVLPPTPSSIPVPAPAAGDPCPVPNKYVCADTTSALLCRNGKRVAMPCRGPNGCRGEGDASKCDDDMGVAGDVCAMSLNENYACTPDHGSEVICKDNTFVVARACKGPKKCAVDGDLVHCDDSLGDVGDPCVAAPDDSNYACTTDRDRSRVRPVDELVPAVEQLPGIEGMLHRRRARLLRSDECARGRHLPPRRQSLV